MTFFKVNDPKNRKLIEDVIAKRAVIREADRRRKMGDAFEYEQLSRFFKPITQQVEKTTEKIEKGVKGLPGEIAKVLPRPINIMQQMQPPPAYEPPFAGEAEIPEEEEKGEEKEKGEEYFNLPGEVEEIGNGKYQIGDEKFEIKDGKIETTNDNIFSKNIINFLTDRKYKLDWNVLNEDEKKFLGKLIVNSDILYKDPNNVNIISPLRLKRWDDVYKPIWYNRFLYMDDIKLKTKFQQEHMKKSLKMPSIKNLMSPETIKKIETSLIKGEGLKGGGLKKNYVTLPSEPSELVDRLTLLSGSKDAGNTGVYNEMVSICDELLKRKIIGKGQYKQFLSNI